jgi:hypothetical protein
MTGGELLPERDRSFLDRKDYKYSVQRADQQTCLTINDFPLPAGFNVANCELLIRLPAGWPDATPDMFWVRPNLTVSGATPAQAQVHEQLLGLAWQRFSRHLTSGQWRPGLDDLEAWMTWITRSLHQDVACAA